MDSFRAIFLAGGIGMFLLAAITSWWMPVRTLSDLEYTTVEQIAPDPIPEWRDMAERWPEAFRKAWGDDAWREALLLPKTIHESPGDPAAVATTVGAYGRALQRGRDLYIAEGCWHCHSQYIRGVSNEELRWGPLARAGEYKNELQRPPLWGTCRVGPDLSREWGTHTNDWQAAHLLDPRSTTPGSVMPAYPWYFDANPAASGAGTDSTAPPRVPSRDGFALIAFVQWLGSWMPERPWDAL